MVAIIDDALAVAERRCLFVVTLWNYKVCDINGYTINHIIFKNH